MQWQNAYIWMASGTITVAIFLGLWQWFEKLAGTAPTWNRRNARTSATRTRGAGSASA